MVKVAKEKTKGKKVGCEAELTNHDSGYIQMEVCYSLYRTILPHYTMAHPLFVLSRLHLATIRAILPLPPRNFHDVGGENDTRDTHEKYVRRRVLFARNTSSLGEFDFLNFRRFIVASVALLSSSSNGNGIDRPHWIMARESG